MNRKAVSLSFLIIVSIMLFSGCKEVSSPDNTADNSAESSENDAPRYFYTAEDQTLITLSSNSLDNTLIGWGLGKSRDSLNRPLDAVKAQEKYEKYSSVFIDDSEKKVLYLTFDEGYENGYTAQILDILKETGVKAAFFVTLDYCKSSPELVRRMIDEGHTVGNHSCTHPSFPECSSSQVEEEITGLHDYVRENFNYEMKFFRFPKGEFSERTLKQVQDLGYTSVFWSFAHPDWDPDNQPSLEKTYEAVTSSLHSGEIYLVHAVSESNTKCLKRIIEYWRAEGFTVGELKEAL